MIWLPTQHKITGVDNIDGGASTGARQVKRTPEMPASHWGTSPKLGCSTSSCLPANAAGKITNDNAMFVYLLHLGDLEEVAGFWL